MKAWRVCRKDERWSTVVFAETRGQARSIAMTTDCCEDAQFCDIEVYRAKVMDKYYKPGKVELEWRDPKDRLALVKELGFYCDPEYLDWSDCKTCSAKKYCDYYQDHLEATKEDADE